MHVHVAFIQGLFKTVHFSEKGTNARIREESTFMLFVDLLNSCEGTYIPTWFELIIHAMWCMSKMFHFAADDDDDAEVSLSTVLSFFTGAEYHHPLVSTLPP